MSKLFGHHHHFKKWIALSYIYFVSHSKSANTEDSDGRLVFAKCVLLSVDKVY